MKQMKVKVCRFAASALVAAMVFGQAGISSLAADTDQSIYIGFNKNGTQAVVIGKNMPGNTYAAQVAIPVVAADTDFSITPADSSVVSEIKHIGDEIVIYIDDTAPIDHNGEINFGTITASKRFNVGSNAEMLFANEMLQETTSTVSIDVRRPSNSSSSDNDDSSNGNTGGSSGSSGGNTGGGSKGDATKPTAEKEETKEQPGLPEAVKTLDFEDVPASHWAKPSIDFVVSKGLFSGTGDGLFSPDGNMTRAMFVSVMYRFESSLGDKWHIPATTAESFIDVPAGTWYTEAVAWGRGTNLVNGTGDGLFSPNAPITREQIAVLLVHYAQLCNVPLVQKEQPVSFTDDSTISPWAKDAVYKAQQAGFLSGRDSGSFAPKDYATRAEVASMLERFIEGAETTATDLSSPIGDALDQ